MNFAVAINETSVTAFFSGLTALLITLNLFLQKVHARKAADGRISDRAKQAGIIATLAKMHADGNGSLGNVLRLYATSERRNYDRSRNPDDLKLAEQAEARATAHAELQHDIEARQVIAEAEFARLDREATTHNYGRPGGLRTIDG